MQLIKNILKDKSFLQKTFAITVPIALQNLLSNLLNLVDTVMISSLGETAVAGVGLANKVFFVFSLLLFGISSGSGVLASQYFGRRELLNIRRVLKISLFIAVGGSLVFAAAGLFFPRLVMRIFTPSRQTITLGALYLSVIAISYPLTAITQSFVAILRSMHFVKLPVLITSLAIAINIFLNYVFIFGHFGMPEMGVAGSALATLIARLAECSLLLFIVFRKKAGDGSIGDFIHAKYEKHIYKEPFLNRAFVSKYIHTASPVIANEFMWGLGITIYSLVYGRMGDSAVAATTITGTIENLILVFFFGLCNAAAVVLGNEMGADRLDRAEEHARHYMVMILMLTVVGAALTFAVKEPIIRLFGMAPAVNDYIRLCLTAFALCMPIRMTNALIIVAILRSGGDTRAALFLDVSSVWLIGIPMAVLGGLVWKFPVNIVYTMILAEEVYKLTLGYLRYRKKKWLRNIVSEEL